MAESKKKGQPEDLKGMANAISSNSQWMMTMGPQLRLLWLQPNGEGKYLWADGSEYTGSWKVSYWQAAWQGLLTLRVVCLATIALANALIHTHLLLNFAYRGGSIYLMHKMQVREETHELV